MDARSRRIAAGLWSLALALVACATAPDKSPAPAPEEAAPVVEPAAPATVAPEAPDDDADAADDDDDADDDADAPAPAQPDALTIADVHKLADAAADEALGGAAFVRTPALVAAWPSEEAKVVFIAHQLIARESSATVHSVGKTLEITVDLKTREASARALEKSKTLKTYEEQRARASLSERVASAEQALVDVLLGVRPLERSLGLLQAYSEWFSFDPALTGDLERRLPKVVAWLRKPSA
ncbi:MAG: hypothetical protein KC636_24585 [Myxococcales bacterium]|nr:hypothetical protein [Myxococcales bacterium]